MFLELRFTVPTPHAADANEDLSPTLTLPGVSAQTNCAG